MARNRMHHLFDGTLPSAVPQGRFLVHNHVTHTVDMRSGVKGFRAWTEPLPPPGNMVECRCGWSGLPHYRMKVVLAPAPVI